MIHTGLAALYAERRSPMTDVQERSAALSEMLDWFVADYKKLLAHGVTFRDDAVRARIEGLSDEQLRDFWAGCWLVSPPTVEDLRAALLVLLDRLPDGDHLPNSKQCGGSEQTQASLEPRQHQGVNTVAPDCEVISAPPATVQQDRGEPHEAQTIKEGPCKPQP